MIVAWEVNKDGKMVNALGLFDTDAQLQETIQPVLAEGRFVKAGDVKEFTVEFVPAAITIKRP